MTRTPEVGVLLSKSADRTLAQWAELCISEYEKDQKQTFTAIFQKLGVLDDNMLTEALIPELARLLMRKPYLLYFLKTVAVKPNSENELVGEDRNVLILLLNTLVRNSTLVGGETSTAKDTLVKAVLSLFPRDFYAVMHGWTDKAVRYLPPKLRILYISEITGRRKEDTGLQDVKLMVSEGELVIWIAPSKGEGVEAKEKRVKVDVIITTDPSLSIPEQFENRFMRIETTGTEEMNKKVVATYLAAVGKLRRQLADYTLDMKIAQVITKALWEKIGERTLEAVRLPGAPALARYLPYDNTAIRRNVKRLVMLWRACPHIFADLRPQVAGDIIAIPEDLWLAMSLAWPQFGQITRNISQRILMAQDLLGRMEPPITSRRFYEKARAEGLPQPRSLRAAQRLLNLLEEHGVVAKALEDDGQTPKRYDGAYIYVLNKDATGAIRPNVQDMCVSVAEEFKSWFLQARHSDPSQVYLPDFLLVDPLTGQPVDGDFLTYRSWCRAPEKQDSNPAQATGEESRTLDSIAPDASSSVPVPIDGLEEDGSIPEVVQEDWSDVKMRFCRQCRLWHVPEVHYRFSARQWEEPQG